MKNNEQMLLSLAELKTRSPVYSTSNKECQEVPYHRNKYGEQSIEDMLPVLLNLFCQQLLALLMSQSLAYAI